MIDTILYILAWIKNCAPQTPTSQGHSLLAPPAAHRPTPVLGRSRAYTTTSSRRDTHVRECASSVRCAVSTEGEIPEVVMARGGGEEVARPLPVVVGPLRAVLARHRVPLVGQHRRHARRRARRVPLHPHPVPPAPPVVLLLLALCVRCVCVCVCVCVVWLACVR